MTNIAVILSQKLIYCCCLTVAVCFYCSRCELAEAARGSPMRTKETHSEQEAGSREGNEWAPVTEGTSKGGDGREVPEKSKSLGKNI